jgi:GDPmannose 4,6-dehydratase
MLASIIVEVVSLITGVTGQDGSYLAEQLLASGAEVIGVIYPREKLPPYFDGLGLRDRCELVGCDLSDPHDFRRLLRDRKPDRVYHLAAQSSPAVCEDRPQESRQLNVTSVEVLLDWIKREVPECRALVVSSAAIFGIPPESPQTEDTPKSPVNEYGRQKLAVLELAQQAVTEDLFVACAIPYNHESPRRREDFVISKIVNSAARIAVGRQDRLQLGNIRARRDWGYAPEYVEAYAWMLDIERPQQLILATGESNSVEDAVALAFAQLELDPAGLVESDPGSRLVPEAVESVGDPARAWREMGWEARVRLPQLIEILVKAAVDSLRS